ncbi:MAG: outer membrane beta-barrel protein [Bdellovibrionales bacterium]
MKKWIVLPILLGVTSLSAQENRSDALRSELDQEIERLYQSTGAQDYDKRVERKRVAQNNLPAKVTYVNPPTAYVEQRPTTYVEAAPLVQTDASKLRKRRENIEVQTEMKIVEKLEQDRIESENERAARLFGNKFDKTQQRPEPVVQQPVYQAPPQTVYVSPATNSAQTEFEKEEFKQDIRDIVTELRTDAVEDDASNSVLPDGRMYALGRFGIGAYPDVQNVEGAYAVGAALGIEYVDGFILEGSFSFSSYDLDRNCQFSVSSCFTRGNGTEEVDQISFGVDMKYKFDLTSNMKPIIGVASAFTMREYTSLTNGSFSGQGGVQSNAFDLGFIAGVDIDLNNKFSVGADLRYMFNISNRYDRDTNFTNTFVSDRRLEDMQYYIFGISGKILF